MPWTIEDVPTSTKRNPWTRVKYLSFGGNESLRLEDMGVPPQLRVVQHGEDAGVHQGVPGDAVPPYPGIPGACAEYGGRS